MLRLVALAALTTTLLLAPGCATGAGNPETPDPLAGAGGVAGGSGAAGAGAGSGGNASAGGGAGPGGQSSAGSSGAIGGENCDPVKQSGCPADRNKCTVIGESFGCDPDGEGAEGADCGADTAGDNCGAGLLCVKGQCVRFCAADAQCGDGKLCTFSIDGPKPGETFKVCEATGSECDPVKQSGCGDGDGCFPQTSGNKCAAAGAAKAGEACEFASDCTAGGACIKLGGPRQCYAICDFATADGCGADKKTCCAQGEGCNKIDDTYGICVAK